MVDNRVAISSAEVHDAGRKDVLVGGQRVVVFPLEDGFVAYVDVCPHQGGPVCSRGSLHPMLTARVGADGRSEEYFEDGGDKIIACPWHGWEFRLETGQAVADASKSLRSVDVSVEGDELVITY